MADTAFSIPGITFFVNENPYCGSKQGFNYRITPVKGKPEDGIDAHLEAFTWYGKLCSELSEKQAEAQFTLDTDGLANVQAWLAEQEEIYRNR